MRWLHGITDSKDMSLSKFWRRKVLDTTQQLNNNSSILPYSTENSTQYSVMTYLRIEFKKEFSSVQFSSVAQSCPTASLSITNSRSSLRLTSIELVMPSSHLILYCPLLLLPPIPPSIRVFSNESTLHMRWPKYWSFSFSIIPSKEHPGLISFRMDWLHLLAVQGTLKSLL